MKIHLQNPFTVWREISRIAEERFPYQYGWGYLLPNRFERNDGRIGYSAEFLGDLFAAMIKGAKECYKPEILSADAVSAPTAEGFFEKFAITDADLKAADAFPQIERFGKLNDVALVQRCINLFNYSRVTMRVDSYEGKGIRVDGWGKDSSSTDRDTLPQAKAEAEAKFSVTLNGDRSPELANYAYVNEFNGKWDYTLGHSAARFTEEGYCSGNVTAWGVFSSPDSYNELDSSFVSSGNADTFYRLFTGTPIAKGGSFDFDPVPQQKEITGATEDKRIGYEMEVYAVIDRGIV